MIDETKLIEDIKERQAEHKKVMADLIGEHPKMKDLIEFMTGQELLELDKVLEIIKKQPQSFNVEEIVKELEELCSAAFQFGAEMYKDEFKIVDELHYGMFLAYDRAIEIIRNGGVNDGARK